MTDFRESDHARHTDGRFAEMTRREPVVNLGEVRAQRTLAERFRQLAAGGYVQASTIPSAAPTSVTEDRDEWWDRSWVSAEYADNGKSYPQMPDDYTPAQGSGQALSGNRRTHRMRYSGAGVDMRMPSATSIRRFSDEKRNATFEVPVSVSINGGPTVNGWVRVTRTGPNSWHTTALGSGTGAGADQVAEAVASVLESRAPTRALMGAGDLLAKRRARRAAEGVEPEPVKSSFIDGIGYNETTGTMTTVIGGKTYGHQISRKLFDAVRSSERPGAIFNSLVKKNPREAVTTCQKCGRIHSAMLVHKCPTGHKARLGIDAGHTEAARARALRRSAAAVPVDERSRYYSAKAQTAP